MAEHQAARARQALIIDTPPTPNGDLHVGHLAGPFIAADVYARYLRMTGRPVVFSTGTDDNQTYVLASARRKGIEPGALCRRSAAEIGQALAGMRISLDGYAPSDDRYRAAVLDFLVPLHAAGKFRLRTVRFPYSERSGEFLVEGLVAGYCPTCLAESRGGLCESCGHPIDFDELIEPRSTVDPADQITTRAAEILVLPMEQYRSQLVDFYRQRESSMRPRTMQLVREVLARPLPDFPITYPVGWGIPAPFEETPGQTVNAWAEGIPAVMYCTTFAAERLTGCAGFGGRVLDYDTIWRAEQAAEISYFIGFDNVYFWGMTHLALLMAHEGRYALPHAIISNEFYELDNEKFSTSLGHVVYARDLLGAVPRDLIRFYLAITAPEHQRMNFSLSGLRKIVRQRLADPWNELADLLAKASATEDMKLPVSDQARARAAAVLARFRLCYDLPTFSLTRAADLIAAQLARLLCAARSLSGQAGAAGGTDTERLGDLLYEVSALITGAAPILVDLADSVTAAGGLSLRLDPGAPGARWARPITLPLIRWGGHELS